jgi:hypothetical protein
MTNDDIRIDVYTSGNNCHMTLIHLPTGIHVSGDGIIQFKLKQDLLKQLEVKINSTKNPNH